MTTRKEKNTPGGRQKPTHPDDVDPRKSPVKEEPNRSGKFSHEKEPGKGGRSHRKG